MEKVKFSSLEEAMRFLFFTVIYFIFALGGAFREDPYATYTFVILLNISYLFHCAVEEIKKE